MNILLTLYLAGMPVALATLLWALVGIGDDDWHDLMTMSALDALVIWVVLWPLFLALSIYDVWTER